MRKILLILFIPFMLNAQSFMLLMDDATDNTGTVLLDSLKAYWAMGDTSDSYANNELTNSGVTFVTGKVGNCGNFEDSEDDYMTISDNATLNVYQQDFTIACWFNLETAASYIGLLTKSGDIATREYYLLAYNQDATPDAPTLAISADGSAVTSISDDALPSTGTWYFIVVWYSKATDSIYLQVDNGTILQSAFATDIYGGTSAFTIGRTFGGSTSLDMDGLIDEVGYWKRVLTPAERTYLYNSGAGRTYSGGKIQ